MTKPNKVGVGRKLDDETVPNERLGLQHQSTLSKPEQVFEGIDDDNSDASVLVLPYLDSSTSITKTQDDQTCEDDSLNHLDSENSSHTASSFSVTVEQLNLSDTETSNPAPTLARPHHIVPRYFDGIEEDDIMESEDARYLALNFVAEHRVFLKAALMLLTERDKQAPALGMLDPIVIKAGPLKKAAHLMNGVWKVKYVEIRRGMFSYYENAVSRDLTGEQELLRKDISLEASTCECRPVRLHQKAFNFTPLGALFELSFGGSKRLWMANSREERHAWMNAIQHAMVGGSVTRGDAILDDNKSGIDPKSPYRGDVRLYAKTQSKLSNAKTMQEYRSGLRDVLNQSLQVPVDWVAKQSVASGGEEMAGAFREDTIDLSVDQLWRDLQRDSIKIDGEIFKGDTGHGPERIVAALIRRIMEVSQSSYTSGSLSESQALALARDALLASNRTRTGGDSYFCMKSLCKNDNLVVLVPKAGEVEPTSLEVSEDHLDHSLHSRLDSKKGWIKTRNLLNRSWKRRYFVLSEGTLSYYEGAHPRPHGLRAQMFMKDATFSVKRREESSFVLSVTVSEGTAKLRETFLWLESESSLIDWVYALECTARSKYVTTQPKKAHRRKGSSRDIANASSDIVVSAKQATFEHLESLGIAEDQIESRIGRISRRTRPALRIKVNAWTEYKICTLDPEGDESLDTWATIRTDFLQVLKMTGGPNGRITRGKETVRVTVQDCIGGDLDMSHSSLRRGRMRMFRKNSSDDPSHGESNKPRDNGATAISTSPEEKEAGDGQGPLTPQRRSMRTRRLFGKGEEASKSNTDNAELTIT